MALVAHLMKRMKSMESEVADAFHILDKNKNGALDRKELKKGVAGLGLLLNESESAKLFDELDVDGNNSVTLKEL
jgi:Ca2+-binding EF-hand superfamily protein